MKILILNTHSPYNGAGNVALDLFNQLKFKGHDVKLLVNSYNKNYPEGIISMETPFSKRLKLLIEKIEWRIDRLRDLLKIKDKYQKDPDYYFFELDEKKRIFSTRKILRVAGYKPDVIFILYAKGIVNSENIYQLQKSTGAKIFWLLFDMAPFTGGCHYAWECKGYQIDCGKCPGLFSSDPGDISNLNLMYKKKFLDQVDINVMALSEWQYRQTKLSSLFRNKTIHKILLTIDTSVFKPVDKIQLRKSLKIKPDKKIIFFGAVSLTEKRKGMQYLIESLNILKEIITINHSELGNNILLLIAGKGYELLSDLLPFESHYMGYLNNTDGIASAYQAADIYLCPSIEDSSPTMVNQSIMTGTPVVSFEMGVSMDLVITGETGHRAKIRDSKDMAEGLFNILNLNSDEYNKLSVRCRELAMELCSPESRMAILEDLMRKN
jgi:glycosyltransferase involved in cell wall biosynthesis